MTWHPASPFLLFPELTSIPCHSPLRKTICLGFYLLTETCILHLSGCVLLVTPETRVSQ